MISAYYKQASDLITTYQFTEFDQGLGRELIVLGYANSDHSEAYGMEFTLRNTFAKAIELPLVFLYVHK